MRDVEALELLHAVRAPATWLQLGLRRPELLTIPRCGTVGVDPAPRIEAGGNAGKPWLKLYALETGAFFATEEPKRVLDGLPLDFAVIAGDSLQELAEAIDGLAGWTHAETWAALFAGDGNADDLRRLALLLGEQRPGWQARLVAVEPAPFLILTGLPATDNGSALALPGDDAAWELLEGRLADIKAVDIEQALPGDVVTPMTVTARLEPGGWFRGAGRRRRPHPRPGRPRRHPTDHASLLPSAAPSAFRFRWTPAAWRCCACAAAARGRRERGTATSTSTCSGRAPSTTS